MKSEIKNWFLIIILFCGAIYLTACHKNMSQPSIVGTWSLINENLIITYHDTATSDTLVLQPLASTITFGSNGYYKTVNLLFNSGSYIYNHDTLTLIDTTVHPSTPDVFIISGISANSFTTYQTDTFAVNPISARTDKAIYSR